MCIIFISVVSSRPDTVLVQLLVLYIITPMALLTRFHFGLEIMKRFSTIWTNSSWMQTEIYMKLKLDTLYKICLYMHVRCNPIQVCEASFGVNIAITTRRLFNHAACFVNKFEIYFRLSKASGLNKARRGVCDWNKIAQHFVFAWRSGTGMLWLLKITKCMQYPAVSFY